MFWWCVHIKWFWKFCNILDINFLQKKGNVSQEKFLHVVGGGGGGTTLQLIVILLNRAEDLLCIFLTVSKALYCPSVYCIFITFKEYTTMSRAWISLYSLQHREAICFSCPEVSWGMWSTMGSQLYIHLCVKRILWDSITQNPQDNAPF